MLIELVARSNECWQSVGTSESFLVIKTDLPVVVGSGVAGLSIALGLREAIVITTGELGSTAFAQGGIAAAMGKDDSTLVHATDTLTVSGGLAAREVVEVLTEGGPKAIARLAGFGAEFDRNISGDLELGREAGHQRRRIVHADGDATGLEVQKTLSRAAEEAPNIEFWKGWRALSLVRSGRRLVGIVASDPNGDLHEVRAPAVALATGGIGRLYSKTTNPVAATGDGVAMAARGGVRLADLEFVQFHPTALDAGKDPMPLLTEALRGEGATLVNGQGRRFMLDHHKDGELAPRDVVARGIWWQLDRGLGAWLDATSIGDFPERFPTVFRLAGESGLDPQKDLMPVSPAAHYFMGGIDTDEWGRSSLPGLWAAGEVACTGVHGANRLASGSLLEGLVFGARAAESISRDRLETSREGKPNSDDLGLSLDETSLIEDVRRIMWERVGLVRHGNGVWEARERLMKLEPELTRCHPGRVAYEVARLVTAAALRRSESRGSHYRVDYPEPDPFQRQRIFVQPMFQEEK